MGKTLGLLFIAFNFLVSACTGGKNASIDGPGSLKINAGELINVDVQDVLALNVPDFTLSLRSLSPDYSTSKILLNFTPLVAEQLATGASSKVHFILPKNLGFARPLLVVADIPSLNTQLISFLFENDVESRPGIASTLTYTLMKYFPGKVVTDYSALDVQGIQALIQARNDQLISESEHLNLSTLPFPKLLRYFKNGVAFNIDFLEKIRAFGINYTYDSIAPVGLVATDTPEGNLDHYRYAAHFKINGVDAEFNPFNHSNNAPTLSPGVSQPNPGQNLFISEGHPVEISAQGFDLDDDFIDKNMIVQYIPRVLPLAVTTRTGFPVIPEPTPEYTVLTQMTDPAGIDLYSSPNIGYNEALDSVVYPNTLAIDAVLYPAEDARTDTAYRNIYYLVSDGMMRVPYRWNFKYADVNRQPKIVRDADNKMTDTYFDDTIASGEGEVEPGSGWKVHGAHCESDSTVLYQTIKNKSEGPWSCAFRMTDPDLDADPNAAADTFNYTLSATDNTTTIKVNGQKIWPAYVAPYVAIRVPGTTIDNCTTPDGVHHYRCGVGLYQVVIDNSVKAAAESKTSQSYSYDVVIYDRPVEIGGNSTSASISKTISLVPQPAMLFNYSSVDKPSNVNTDLSQTIGTSNPSYVRKDTYLSELLLRASNGSNLNNLSDIGMGGTGLNNAIAGAANRAAFLAGTAQEMSPFVTQPHAIQGGSVHLDPITFQATSANPGSLNFFGHSITTSDTATYSKPYEFDSTCSLSENNKGSDWDQDAYGGWTFEIDAIDYDNVPLAVGEASDPVHVSIATDIATQLNALGLQYCTYTPPNADPAYYQTYQATASAAAVNPDACVWSANAPADLQPIPVYFTANDGGTSVVKKWVYHRMRFKWQPKDQGMIGKTTADPPFYIRNTIASGLKLFGNRAFLKGENLDQTIVTQSGGLPNLSLFATRKDMKPCLSGLAGKSSILHQMNVSPGQLTAFSVSDENKTLASLPTQSGAIMGRFETEIKLLGTRAINHPNFLQLVPYVYNCGIRDVDVLVNPTAPPATVAIKEPAIWYSQASDNTDAPRVRFQSRTDPSLTSMCIDYSLSPAKNLANAEYNEVILIRNTSVVPFTLSNSLFANGCTSRTQLLLNPDQKWIALASTCGSSHTQGQTLWSDASSTATVAYLANPSSSASGSLPPNTSLKLDLLPSFYQAGLAVNFPGDFDLANVLLFSSSIFDTFRLDPTTGYPIYTGYVSNGAPTWLSTNPTNAIDSTPPGSSFAGGFQVVDWDNQATNLSIATPTPNPDVFYRMAPGDANRIQVYVRNHGTASFPIKVSDVSDVFPLEQDPYDIMTYQLNPPGQTPNGIPSFVGINRPDCQSKPSNYPALSSLNTVSLADFKTCRFNWTPSTSADPSLSDDGHKFSYTFSVQDNFGANATSLGIGARHPAGTGNINFDPLILNDGLTKTNGPAVSFNLDIEAIETNSAPFFVSAGGSSIAQAYNSSGGAPGWTSVYAANSPSGQQSACATGSSALAGGAFSCASASARVQSGDTLQSNAPLALVQGSQQSFTVYAKDNSVTPQLKTITASPPNSVLIVDGIHQGLTYRVPSFQGLTLSTSQDVGQGTANFSFSWTPTDAEANYLSNPGGFLIPVTITDQAYAPASDSDFPSAFKVPALQSTVWIWAKLSVVNTQPQVFYLSSGNEVPLDSATIPVQTGAATPLTIRIKDFDTARWTQSGSQSGFAPSFSAANPGPAAFTTVVNTAAAVLEPSGRFITQDYTLSINPSSSDIGIYTSPQISVTDPGNPSLGLAINPDSGTPPAAQVFSAGNSFSVPFIFQIIGKPQFLAPGPGPGQSQAYAFSSQSFQYPLALSISRQNELNQAFFVGINQAGGVAPLKTAATGAGSTGIYVSYVGDSVTPNFVLKWPDSNSSLILNPPNQDRTIPLYGVRASYCNVSDGSTYPALTLLRYNETTGAMESCKLSANNRDNNAASASLTLTLVSNTQLAAPVASINLTELSRNYQPVNQPADATAAQILVNKQFADFFGRCTNCTSLNTSCNANRVGLSLTMNTASNSCTDAQNNTHAGFAEYLYNSYLSRFAVDSAGSFNASKLYQDQTPSSARTLTVSASKGETIRLRAKTSTPYDGKYQYRWYVNGCLKSSGLITGADLSYDLKITSQMSGLNNNCTGQFGFAEVGASNLGKVVIRLSLVKGTEGLSASSESSVSSYLWNVAVLNKDPSIITSTDFSPSAPVSLSSQMTGNRNVQFALPVSFASKNYLAYTDLNSSSGLKIRLNELDTSGSIASAGSALSLACDPSFTAQPLWIGFQPQTQTPAKLVISASTNATYPLSTSAQIAYASRNQGCFTNSLTIASPAATAVQYDSSGSTVPAGYLGFSRYTMSTRTLASYSNASQGTLYKDNTNDSNFFLIDGKLGTNNFWTYAPANLYPTVPLEFQAPFSNNFVRKNIVSDAYLFQLIGTNSPNSTGWRGFVSSRTLSNDANKVVAADGTRIMFAAPGASPAPPSANDCQFNGTPLDGVYVPSLGGQTVDTLFVLAASSSTGKLVAIRNVTGVNGTPTCSELANVSNPSLLDTDHNASLSKMVYDSAKGLVYGIINPGGGAGGQFFTLDLLSEQVITRNLSSTLAPYELIFSPNINALYLFDNRKSTSPALSPTLYKIW